jgi:beta-lactamase class A
VSPKTEMDTIKKRSFNIRDVTHGFRKIAYKHFYIYLSLIFLGFIFGFFLYPLINQTQTNKPHNPEEKRLYGNYKFINPLLECVETLGDSQPINKLRNLVISYVDGQKAAGKITDIAVYYRDLNNGPWFGINEKAYFAPASLVKVPLLIAYLELTESNPTILKNKLPNNLMDTEEIYKQMNYPPEEKLKLNSEYTIEELLNRMITYSDNVAYEILFRNLDNKMLKKIYDDLGIDVSKSFTDPGGNVMSLRDYSGIYRVLYNSSYLDKDLSEKALQILSTSKFMDGLREGVPESVPISHKFGERSVVSTGEKQLHDCGIIYSPANTYILCIMTRGTNFTDLANTIKNISSMVYSYINAK